MSEDAPSFDVVLDLCAHKHRRIVLGVLATQRRSLTIEDLTRAIVEHTYREPPTAVADEAKTEIEAEIHHDHAPRLEDADLVEYDRERQLVEPTEQFDRVETLLSEIFDADSATAPPLDL